MRAFSIATAAWLANASLQVGLVEHRPVRRVERFEDTDHPVLDLERHAEDRPGLEP